ncbi:MAG: M42 family peptidase [Ruminococcus sp.]|nr:M42 family peptidase [Ruminococcus sp.]
MDRTKLKELIKSIANSGGVSGNENETALLCADIMKKYTEDIRIKNGNVIARFGKRTDGKPHVLLDAHLDRVGMIVTYITDGGFVKADCIGGLDRRIFPAQRVRICCKDGEAAGVVCTLPPHLKKDGAVTDKDMIYIDPLMSAENAKKIISPGDSVFFDSPCSDLNGNRICGAALDDRCGIAAVIQAVDLLNGEYGSLPYSFSVMFSAQEELGERGACIGAFDEAPDIAVAVDVSFAVCGGEKPEKCGELAKGCMIGISPSLDREMSRWFTAYAEKNGIPFQYEVMNGTTGTNADRFSVSRGGCKAVTLSIPLRYMHTPCEVTDISDIEATARLICAFLKEGGV